VRVYRSLIDLCVRCAATGFGRGGGPPLAEPRRCPNRLINVSAQVLSRLAWLDVDGPHPGGCKPPLHRFGDDSIRYASYTDLSNKLRVLADETKR
jgi:hypothetical protein